MGFMKNKFVFIIFISLVTLIVLIVGAFSLYQDNSSVFSSNGYILETSTKAKQKYYFSANTKYKESVDDKISFNDTKSKKVSVDPASFVHFDNGNISFLQRGALVNLSDLTSPMVSYYNVNSNNIITYDNGKYIVTSNGKKVSIDSFVGRISDKKYIVAGKNLQIKVPSSADRISGDYFELYFIENGIVKIDNKDVSYQVTAEGSYLFVGDNIAIDLGSGKISVDNDTKMLLSQITINGNENIDLDVNKKDGNGADGSGGSGGEGGDGDATGDGVDGDGTGGSGDGTGGSGNGAENGNGLANGNGSGTNNVTASPQIELIDVNATSTSLDLSMQLNNASLARGNVVAYFTNVATGQKDEPKSIPLTNGTFKLSYSSLTPNTEYALSIVEVGIENEKQYFQKTFRTKDLGITLEKVYASEDSLSYNVIFDDNTDVSKAKVTIYDNNGKLSAGDTSEFIISKDDLDNSLTFTGLKSNTSYSVSVETVWINNTVYNNLYSIDRIDTTLKKKPTISDIKVTPNAEEVKFNIELDNVKDPDNSIISYVYNIYLADDITLDNLDPEVVYTVTKNDHDALILNLNEIDLLKTGVNYRCKIIAQYNDNEMIREVSTDYSGNFLIKSKPNVSFELKSATMNKVTGTLSLIDANCTVPMSGRSCSNSKNTFTLRYYKLKETETTDNDTVFQFDPVKLTTEITLSDLSSNTTYAVKVFGNYYDDDNILHSNVQIGDTFYVKTDKSDKLQLEVIGDNISGKNKDGSDNPANVVTFDAKLVAPQNSTIVDEISTITLNLYSGRYNTKDKLIGTYKMTSKAEIENFFSNITIRNAMFNDATSRGLGFIDSLDKMIKLTNNSTGTLNGSYTVSVDDVYDSTGANQIQVEDNVYTFNLTPSYYLDTRIATNPKDNYVTVTPIKKESLTDSEYKELSKKVSNLDDLNDDTVVGVIIENSLSDTFVDSAFTYEKATVNFTIYNGTNKKDIKTFPVEMGNKYQPKQITVYLDSSDLDDGKHFTRGYNYKIGFNIAFTTEDGSNPTYTNDSLYKNIPIERQNPIYKQYIKSSNKNSIVYSFLMNDIDHALYDKNIYYKMKDSEDYLSVENAFQLDGDYHDVSIPFTDKNEYSLYYGRKTTADKIEYVSIMNYRFDGEYNYDNKNAFSIVDDHDNVLKLRFEKNDVTDRAYAYKVVIKAIDKSVVSDYTRYFLASKLSTVSIPTGAVDADGNKVTNDYKYIAIDYANISKFMGNEMLISVYAYYDSGLVGIEQVFRNGLVLEDSITKKYLNIYNGSTNKNSYSKLDNENMGLYLPKQGYNKDDHNIFIYNQMIDTDSYNSLIGSSYYNTKDLASNVGINFLIDFRNTGMTFIDDKKEYNGIQARVLKEAELKTDHDTYQFNTITPTIKVTSGTNTINSVTIRIKPSGIYGNKQFIKDGAEHKKVYVELYSDQEFSNKIATEVSNVNITGDDLNGYNATIDDITVRDLTPATNYYFRVYAYVDGKYTRLYDSSSSTSYITKDYSTSTLNAASILNSIQFSVLPVKYNGESSLKNLTWRLGLRNADNYKLRFELYEPDGTTSKVTDPITGEETEVSNFKIVNFDGSAATSCDVNKTGISTNGYVNGCYISVSKEDVSSANNKANIYSFSGNNFLFGDGYYKLLVYAIPYTKGSYRENEKVLLYQNDSLTNGDVTSNGIRQAINIPKLEEVSASLNNTLSAGYTDKNGYYVSFSPKVTDIHKVIKYGKYHVNLKDEKGNIVTNSSGKDKCLYYLNKDNYSTIREAASCSITLDADSVNQKIEFTGLKSNTLYYVEISYEVYRNNVGYSEEQKISATPFTDFIYTPIASGITLGTITATQSTGKDIMLTYNGSANLSDNIVEVIYTISLKGGSSKTTGSYQNNIFTINTDKTPRLMIDTSDSDHSENTSFTFKFGNTYIISTKYYYMSNGKKTLLKDQETGNDTFTTILNL